MLDYNRRETARSTGVRNVSGTHKPDGEPVQQVDEKRFARGVLEGW